ncbi:MAG: S8 family serine peptidase [Candidatus Njordarchaeia archaeon]
MHKKGYYFWAYIFLICLITSSIGISSQALVTFAQNKPSASSSPSGTYIDPIIKTAPPDKSLSIIMMFKNFNQMDTATPILENYGIRILHKYKIIPATLIEATSEQIKTLLSSSLKAFIRGIYYNNIRHVKLLPPSESNGYVPTTKDSATAIGAQYVWNQGYRGDNVLVAVIDTGIDSDHPDLCWENGTSKVVYSKSFVNTIYGYPTNRTNPEDVYGHGTMVSGIIAGTGAGNPEIGMGVAPNALLMNARVFYKPVGEQWPTATDAGIIAGIEWAVFGDDGTPNTGDEADVINMSLGGGTWYVDPINMAVERAKEYGVVVVVASGNEGDSGTRSMSVGSPGDAPDAITVGAVYPDTKYLKDYSSYGPTIHALIKPELVAPSGISTIKLGGSYYLNPQEGTSFSCPHVAGAVALLVQLLKEKGFTDEYLVGATKVSLMETADYISGYTEGAIGKGFVRVDKAFDFINENAAGSSLEAASILPTKLPTGYTKTEVFFPYKNKIFRGMYLSFNISVVLSYDATVTLELDSELSSVFTLNSPTTADLHAGTNVVEFNATVKATAPLGEVNGTITIKAGGETIGTIVITFEVRDPIAFLGFDLIHTSWTPTDLMWGQYRHFTSTFEDYDVAVEHIYHYRRLTQTLLSRYDILFAPDTATIRGIMDPNSGSYLGNETLGFTAEEISAIKDWVFNGGTLIVIGMDPGTGLGQNNVTNLNQLVSNFGFTFNSTILYNESEPVPVSVDDQYLITSGVEKMPFYGTNMIVDDPNVLVLSTYADLPVLVARFCQSENAVGLVVGLGTNFFFDNWAFEGRYSDIPDEYPKRFVENVAFYASISKNFSISIPTTVSAQRYEFSVESAIPLSHAVLADSLGEVNLLAWQSAEHEYSFNYVPRATGNQTLTLMFYNESTTGRGYVPLKYELTASGSLSDNKDPIIEYVRVKPSTPTGSSTIYIYVNITDDTALSSITAEKDGETLTVYYDYDAGLWVIVVPPVGSGVSKINVTITAVDMFGNSAEEEVSVSISALPFDVTTIAIIAVVVIAVIGVVLILKRRKS